MSARRERTRGGRTGAELRDILIIRPELCELPERERDELIASITSCIGAGSLADQTDAFLRLARWLLYPPEVPADPSRDGLRGHAHLRIFVALLEQSPDIRRPLLFALGDLLANSDGTNLFGEAGLPSHRSFLAEAGNRLAAKLVPSPRNDRDLAALLRRLISSPADFGRLQRIPGDLFHRLVTVLHLDQPDVWTPLERFFSDGFRLLAAWIQGQGLLSRIRSRGNTTSVGESPFLLLGRSSEGLLAAWQKGRGVKSAVAAWRQDAIACRKEMAEVHRQLETEGVSVEIVFGLELIDRSLARMEVMTDIMESRHSAERSHAIQRLLQRLVYFTYQDRRLRHLIAWNLNLLNRKIVERSGRTGEHYIAGTRKEYWHIWAASAGGGLLTVFTAAIKLAVMGAGLALFQEGFTVGLNYAVSFLLLQTFGFMLATKQPAMTAATLANIVRDRRGSIQYDDVVTLAARICQSQFAAAVSNVLVVFAGSYLFDALWRVLWGVPYLPFEEARHVFETLSPVNSGTVFYAAVTGVVLWLASVCGGWVDNFVAYNQISAGIADHPLGGLFGRKRMERAGAFVARNASGWGTNISLGFLLGFTPAIGHFLGIPLDVRHVTLSSGTLALAAASLDQNLFGWGWFLLGVAGVGTMFILNLSVSFMLSFYNAARAYGYTAKHLFVFSRRFVVRFFQRPGEFLLPPS